VEIFEQLAAHLSAHGTGGPALWAVDGRSAAGKTTLADALAAHIHKAGRTALRCSIDDFHPPGHKRRSRAGGYTPESFYEEGYDYTAFRECVLNPLMPGGSRRCRLGLWDSYHDIPLPEEWVDVPDDAVLIVDGGYLFHPTLAACWDFTIWLHVKWSVMVERAVVRDTAWVGDPELVRARYESVWIPAHQHYEAVTNAPSRASLVVDNTRPATPVLLREPQPSPTPITPGA
jgi:uridine kinase